MAGITHTMITSDYCGTSLEDRLLNNVADKVLLELKSAFSHIKEKADLIFSVKQLLQKCTEQKMDLYHVVVIPDKNKNSH